MVAPRPGVGTLASGTIESPSLATVRPLRRELAAWMGRARSAGLDDESIEALFLAGFRVGSRLPPANPGFPDTGPGPAVPAPVGPVGLLIGTFWGAPLVAPSGACGGARPA
ncbi:hypothetical protein GCM10022223_46010 [Kineosporia mesophila]|uniref:Uncharacterized protein n=1 Tax=Kineosporia mesophila TaxID=566012 RepID=A0ABP7A2S6_9ACTN|nr:hypothetical protein [Kineosporia mesophila]MCD5349015.1 hypothetical protein [Kineosporia mesophila]